MAESATKSLVRRLMACALSVGLLASSVRPAPGSDEATGPEPQRHRPTAAFLDLDGSPLTGLLEQRLLENPRAAWLERSAIEEIQREQKLQGLMDTAAGRRRVAIGKLLKADLLVLLRHLKEPEEHVQLVVCETGRGLRLAVHQVVLSPKVEEGVRRLSRLVDRAVAKYGQKIREIIAVPPFVSNDLTYGNEHLQAAYARLVEQTIRDRPGLLTVELEEARAIAREVGLAGGRVRRSLPPYLLGEFRHEGKSDKRKATVRMWVKRGERELASREATGLSPADAAKFVHRAANELIREALGIRPLPPNPKLEAEQLARRAETFHLLGSCDEAAALAEASLLLDSRQPRMREVAASSLGFLALRHRNRRMGADRVARGIHLYLRALEHFEAALPETKPIGEGSLRGLYRHLFWGVKWMTFCDKRYRPPEVQRVAAELRKRELKILLRIISKRARAQTGDEHQFMHMAIFGRPPKEKFEILLETIRDIQRLPDAERLTIELTPRCYTAGILDCPEGRQYLEHLLAIDSRAVRKAAVELDNMLKRRLAQKREQQPAPSASPTLPAGPQRVRFERVDISWPPTRQRVDVSLFKKCIPLRDGIDLFWGPASCLQVMKEPSRLKPVWDRTHESGKFTTIDQVEYDGRFCWASTSNGGFPDVTAGLLVIDPENEKTWSIGQTDGLPVVSQESTPDRVRPRLWIAPFEPGKALFVSWFGRLAIGTVEFDPNTGAVVETFFEARIRRDRTNPDAWRNVHMAFAPQYVLAFRQSSEGDTIRRVLVGGRQGKDGDQPLVVDPDRRKVEILETGLRSGTDQNTWAVTPEALYRLEEQYGKHSLVRIGLPDFRREVIAADVPHGYCVKYGEEFLIFGGTTCWLVDPTPAAKNPIQVVATDLPWPHHRFILTPENPEPFRLGAVCHSNHYGLLAIRDQVRHGSEFFHIVFDDVKKADSK